MEDNTFMGKTLLKHITLTKPTPKKYNRYFTLCLYAYNTSDISSFEILFLQ